MLVENAGPSDKELAIIGQGVILSTRSLFFYDL